MTKKTLTPIILAGIFFLMLGLSFAAVPLYDLFCRVTGFGGTTQNAENKEIPKIVINQDYKIRFDTNSNGALDWKFYPEKNTISLNFSWKIFNGGQNKNSCSFCEYSGTEHCR